MDEFMMDDCMLTKVKRLMYETVELHVNAFNHCTATPHSNAAQLPPVLTISPWQIDRHEILQILQGSKMISAEKLLSDREDASLFSSR